MTYIYQHQHLLASIVLRTSMSMGMSIINTNTNTVEYWLNWRFLLCALWVLGPMVAAAFLIWKHELKHKQEAEAEAVVYAQDTWRPCFTRMHPAWLLTYRVVSFAVLLTLLLLNLTIDGPTTLFYYTIWTFLLVTVYFALGSILSIHGCRQRQHQHQHLHAHATEHTGLIISSDIGAISYPNSNSDFSYSTHNTQKVADHPYSREIAGFWGYLFQIIYQTNAGAVMITDCVFWLIIFPFRAMKDYNLDLLLIGMHSVNAVLLMGDIILNSLRFPWFRIAYFLLFTGIYVIFQWIVHACVSMWWPYPFLDLSSPLSPLWYLVVAVLHLPCYVVYPLVMKLKHFLLSRFFSHSYHFVRKYIPRQDASMLDHLSHTNI